MVYRVSLFFLSLFVACTSATLGENELLLEIAPTMTPCEELVPRQCLLIKRLKPTPETAFKPYFYPIDQFNFKAGTSQKIVVRPIVQDNSDTTYHFVRHWK